MTAQPRPPSSALITWAVVPAKPFSEAKSRLGSVLSAEDRHALARRLLHRTVDVLLQAGALDRVVVVSRDEEALALAQELGADGLVERGQGLNPALAYAAERAVEGGASRLLVMPSDLPMLSPSDVRALLAAGDESTVAIAHDRHHDGTNGLLLAPPTAIEFRFGLHSFNEHLALARAAGIDPAVVSRPGLAFDIDYPGDLEDLEIAIPEEWRNSAIESSAEA